MRFTKGHKLSANPVPFLSSSQMLYVVLKTHEIAGIPILARGNTWSGGQVRFPHTAGTNKNDVLFLSNKGVSKQRQDRFFIQLRLKGKVKGIEGLLHREFGRLQPSFDGSLLAKGYLFF